MKYFHFLGKYRKEKSWFFSNYYFPLCIAGWFYVELKIRKIEYSTWWLNIAHIHTRHLLHLLSTLKKGASACVRTKKNVNRMTHWC